MIPVPRSFGKTPRAPISPDHVSYGPNSLKTLCKGLYGGLLYWLLRGSLDNGSCSARLLGCLEEVEILRDSSEASKGVTPKQ